MGRRNPHNEEGHSYFDSPVGLVRIGWTDTYIVSLYFGEDIQKPDVSDTSALAKEAERQVREYFAGERTEFDLPLAPKGTEFQRKVWDALLDIPYGETRSYKEIAEAIGNPKAYRAVGMANNKNPISIIIPCHRVIGANGDLVGYGGGLAKKVWLLELEEGNK